MGQKFINGAQYAVSTTLATAVATTDISNADPAVVSTATTPTAGDIVILQSGWSDLDGRAVRVASASAGVSFTLEGVDTTDTTRYPAGEGEGSYQTASGFTPLTQIRGISTNGGEQNNFQYQYVEDRSSRQRSAPTFKSAMTMEIEMDFDPALPWYDALVTIDGKTGVPVVLREVLPSGDTFYYAGLMSFNKVPTKQVNQNMTVTATFAINSDPIRYAAA